MESPKCKRCNQGAGFNLAFHLSTIGRKKRLQKMSKGIRLCHSCMQAVQEEVSLVTPSEVSDLLSGAYTAIADGSGEADTDSAEAVQR